VDGLDVNSFADFIRVTAQPAVIHKAWESRDLRFWIPAFKIRPKVYLRTCRQMTVSQPDLDGVQEMKGYTLFPVTLPRSEAAESMKVTFADASMVKRRVFSLLPRLSFAARGWTLVYLPFRDTGHDLVQQHTRVTLPGKAVEFGRYL
jgi:hypothetical protein